MPANPVWPASNRVGGRRRWACSGGSDGCRWLVDDVIDDRPAVEIPALLLYPVVLLEALPSLADVVVADVLAPVPVPAAESRKAAASSAGEASEAKAVAEAAPSPSLPVLIPLSAALDDAAEVEEAW